MPNSAPAWAGPNCWVTIADVIGDKMAPCPAVPDFTTLLEEDAARA